jgi:hypothetical protein
MFIFISCANHINICFVILSRHYDSCMWMVEFPLSAIPPPCSGLAQCRPPDPHQTTSSLHPPFHPPSLLVRFIIFFLFSRKIDKDMLSHTDKKFYATDVLNIQDLTIWITSMKKIDWERTWGIPFFLVSNRLVAALCVLERVRMVPYKFSRRGEKSLS